VILITGTPGVGKTTIAQKLTSKLGADYLGISELVKEQQLFTGEDKERNTLIADTEEVKKYLKKILTGKTSTTVIDGHYAVEVTPTKQVNMVFVLRRDPRQLKAVLEKRGYDMKKVWENMTAEILDVCLWDSLAVYGSHKVCEIDVTNKTAEKVVEEATQVLENKKECKQGTIDWINKLENAGQLEKFLKKMV
jgi:adenylate kinase